VEDLTFPFDDVVRFVAIVLGMNSGALALSRIGRVEAFPLVATRVWDLRGVEHGLSF
jgi:hypothetical protein